GSAKLILLRIGRRLMRRMAAFPDKGSTARRGLRSKLIEMTLRQVNARCGYRRHHQKMAQLIFRCAQTGLNVQAWLPDATPAVHTDSYEAVICPACARLHLVNK